MDNKIYEITVTGESYASFQSNGSDVYVKVRHTKLAELDGISVEDDFTDYFDEDLDVLGLSNGYMRFSYHQDKLWTITTYQAESLLTEEQLRLLALYTRGQWSDGIGEHFEQFPCKCTAIGDYYISPWHKNQTVKISQGDIVLIIPKVGEN